MKKIYIISICIILIIVLTAGIVVIPDNKSVVEKLICERIDILNDYYKDDLTVNEAYKLLKQIEYGNILTEDTAGLDAYAQTDIDQIISYRIISLSEKKNTYGHIYGKVVIEWVMKNISDVYNTRISYSYRCNKVNGKYKITYFDLKS